MAPAPSPAEERPPVALEIACQSSTTDWQLHLEQLFNNARDRFPDVVWELLNDGDILPSEEVWGHKGGYFCQSMLHQCDSLCVQLWCMHVHHRHSKRDIFRSGLLL